MTTTSVQHQTFRIWHKIHILIVSITQVKAQIKTSYIRNNHTKHMNDIKQVLHGYICSNSDGINECLFGRKSIKVWIFLEWEETQRSACLWHAGRTKEEEQFQEQRKIDAAYVEGDRRKSNQKLFLKRETIKMNTFKKKLKPVILPSGFWVEPNYFIQYTMVSSIYLKTNLGLHKQLWAIFRGFKLVSEVFL